MSIFRKLNTLLRAGARESAERITDANAIRIYRGDLGSGLYRANLWSADGALPDVGMLL